MKIINVLVIAFSIMAGGCMAHEMTVNVVVFNYTQKPLANVSIQAKYIGGYYQEYSEGTGGKIYCCIDVKSGDANVSWEYDRDPSDNRPDDYFKRSISGVIPEGRSRSKYLGVHVYPSEGVEFTLSRDIPPERKEGEP